MNAGDRTADDLSPSERRLTEHLELLRAAPPATPPLVPRVIRGVRWQRAVRDPLLLVGAVATAFLEGLGAMFERPSDRS